MTDNQLLERYNMDENISLRDLIYLDVNKASSLLSQIEGGLLKELKESTEASDNKLGEGQVTVPIVSGKVAKETTDKTAREETRIRHHDLLNIVEKMVFTNGFALDLNEAVGKEIIDGTLFRELISDVSYIRAEGWATIDDFRRLQSLAQNYSYLVDFINKCSRQAIERTTEYQAVLKQVEQSKAQLKNIKDRNEKSKQKNLIQSNEKKLEELVQKLTQTTKSPDNWLLEGISKWIDQFNANQIHFRLSPFPSGQIEIVSNLKPEYFVDTDIDHLLFSYGSRPNIKLTLFGLITSIPPAEPELFNLNNPLTETTNNQGKAEQFEEAFKKVFQAMNALESFSSFANFPNIKVFPIAVYRKIHSYYREENSATVEISHKEQ